MPIHDPIRIDRFKCIMGTWTYAVVSGHAVVGYYRSWWLAKKRAAEERAKMLSGGYRASGRSQDRNGRRSDPAETDTCEASNEAQTNSPSGAS